MNSRSLLYTVLSAAVTVGVFAALFTQVSPSEVLRAVGNADPVGVAAFVVLSIATTVFRTWRYRLLLRVSGHDAPRVPLFLIVLVRNLFADLLPARLGSLVYVHLVTSRLGIPLAAASSSFAAPFFFDLLALGVLLVLAGLAAPSGSMLGAGLAGAGVVLALGTLAGWFVLTASLTSARLRAWLEAKAPARLTAALDAATSEVDKLAAARVHGRVFALSLLVRVGKYASLHLFLFALVAPHGYALADLDVAKVFFGIAAAEAATSLPISGLAGFGAYEGTWAVVFELLGFPQKLAVLTSLSHHLFTQAYGYVLGAAALVLLMLPGRRAGGDAAPLRAA